MQSKAQIIAAQSKTYCNSRTAIDVLKGLVKNFLRENQFIATSLKLFTVKDFAALTTCRKLTKQCIFTILINIIFIAIFNTLLQILTDYILLNMRFL